MMRYGVNRLARFSSPDPLSGSLGDPQSLNKYPYALNDPGNLIDPLGLCGGGPGGVSSGIITGDTFRGTWTSTGPEQSFTSAPCPGDDPAGPSYGMQSIYGGGAGGLSASE